MFIVLVEYKKPLEMIEPLIPGHVAFLEEGYRQQFFVASGAKIPRTGGVIIANIKDRLKLESFLKQDPFYQHDVANYDIIEFTPSKFQPAFKPFID